jgi:hypothetical protein
MDEFSEMKHRSFFRVAGLVARYSLIGIGSHYFASFDYLHDCQPAMCRICCADMMFFGCRTDYFFYDTIVPVSIVCMSSVESSLGRLLSPSGSLVVRQKEKEKVTTDRAKQMAKSLCGASWWGGSVRGALTDPTKKGNGDTRRLLF